MNCDQVIDIILAIGRVSVLILGMLSGTFSIYLGWRLYTNAVISRTTGEISYKSLKMVLTGGGPGVFLAIFGAYIIITITGQKVDLSTSGNGRIENTTAFSPVKVATPAFFLTANQTSTEKGTVKNGASHENPCLIIQRKRMLFSGETESTTEDIRNALDLSLQSLDQQRQALYPAREGEFREAISIIEDLRKGVIE